MHAEYQMALDWYLKGSEVDFLYPRSYNNIATIYYMQHDNENARKYFNQAIAVDATYPRAYYGLGLLAYLDGDTVEAESKFLDAVRVGSMPEAIYMLGVLNYDRANYEQSESWFKRYLEVDPSGEWAEKSRDMLVIIGQKRGQK
jgi:tetratricopeptide (TPR) repeat protein